MANEEQLAVLRRGVEPWNHWRDEHPDEVIDLQRADLRESNLLEANLSGADLSGAVLRGANLHRANLSRAVLAQADLSKAVLTETDFQGADLADCQIYGIAAWGLKLDKATKQADLVITPADQPTITVDNLEVAQFVYLLLNNEKIRDVINTVTSKVVLILGRFTEERKAVLDALRDELRKRDYLPILFDFDKPASLSLTETIQTLAGMARFVIADLTDARSLPQELMAIVPNRPSVAVQPLLVTGASEFALFEHFRRYPWVLREYCYDDTADLLAALTDRVIAPAETKAAELQGPK
jgi:hypothetical protein